MAERAQRPDGERPDPGTGAAADAAPEELYRSLHRMAERAMERERADHTLQPTALVHEAWLRLAGALGEAGWDRERFLAVAARTMRRALVDHARRRGADRRGGGAQRVTLTGLEGGPTGGEALDLLALDQALAELAQRSERQARVVELRWFGGLSFEEIGRELGVSDRTAKNDWRVARAWLGQRLDGAEPA